MDETVRNALRLFLADKSPESYEKYLLACQRAGDTPGVCFCQAFLNKHTPLKCFLCSKRICPTCTLRCAKCSHEYTICKDCSTPCRACQSLIRKCSNCRRQFCGAENCSTHCTSCEEFICFGCSYLINSSYYCVHCNVPGDYYGESDGEPGDPYW